MRFAETTVGPVRIRDDTAELLAVGPTLDEAVRSGRLAELAGAQASGEVPVSSLSFRPPVRPTTIFIVGLNYRGHVRELGVEPPAGPRIHRVPGTAVVGAGEPIVLPAAAPDQVDYEGELVVVLGRPAWRIRPDEAWARVAGLTIGNDVTARDVQQRGAVAEAKGFATFKPLGPALLVADGAAPELSVRTIVDGEVRQDATTADLIVGIPELIAAVSQDWALQPGDVIFTGTPAGVGWPTGSYLRPGQTVEVVIPGIGTLANVVTGPREPSTARGRTLPSQSRRVW